MKKNVSAQAHSMLSEWFHQRPVFALMGEYSAGKSTLLNLLLGQKLLPTRVTATNMPPVWITYGDDLTFRGLDYDGKLYDLSDMEMGSGELGGYLAIRMTAPADILRQSDILDTPGISDPRLAAGVIQLFATFTDFVVWCTPANQAWRQSEGATWMSLPKRLRDVSLLTVTRLDKINTAKDVDKVIRRCTKEAEGLFRYVCPISALRAMEAYPNLDSSAKAKDVWDASGADYFFSQLGEAIASTSDMAEQRLTASPEPENSVVKVNQTADIVADIHLTSSISQILAENRNISSNEQIVNLFDHLLDKIADENELSNEHAVVISRALSLEGLSGKNVVNVIKQAEHEIADFAESAWCRLDKTN